MDYKNKLIADMEAIVNTAKSENRSLTDNEIAQIEMAKRSLESVASIPSVPATVEVRSAQPAPALEFRAKITTTGSATLDGTKAESFWNKVKENTIIRQYAKVIRGNGKSDIPVGASGGFGADSLVDNASFDAVKLSAKSYRNKVRIAEDLFDDATYDIESAIAEMSASDWSQVEDLYVLQGSASGMAGVFAQLDTANRKVVSATFTVAKLLETVAKLKAVHVGKAKAFVTPNAYGIILQGLDTNKQIANVGGKIYIGNIEVVPVDGLTVAHALVLNPAEVAMLLVNEVETKKLVEAGAEAGEIIFINKIRVDAKLRDTGALSALTAS
jgi:HK97 family phage major capsid protein